MQVLQARDGASIGQRHRLPHVAGAVAGEESTQRIVADLQREVPQAAFDLVQRPTVAAGFLEQVENLRHQGFHQFLLENRPWFCDAHVGASLRVCTLWSAAKLSAGGPFDYQAVSYKLVLLHRLRRSGRAVTPSFFRRSSSSACSSAITS